MPEPEPKPIIPNDQALNILWGNESGWKPGILNKNSVLNGTGSVACGIPQAKPCTKIPGYEHATGAWIRENYVVGDDGRFYLPDPNEAAEISWGLDYIKDRYGTPAAALHFWRNIAPTIDINGDGTPDNLHFY